MMLKRYTGCILALFANTSFTLMDAAAQSSIKHGLAPSQVAFLRMALTLPVVLLCIIIQNPSGLNELDPRSRPCAELSDNPELNTLLRRRPAFAARLIWLRSFLTSVALCLLYAGLSRVTLSEFITVASTKAFIIGFLCWAVLRETFGWRLKLASVVSCIAVLLIVQPHFLFGANPSIDPSSRIVGFALCLGSLIMDALEMVVVRALGPGPNPVVMMLAYALTCVFVGPIFLLIIGESLGHITDNIVYAKLVLVAGLGLIAQICLVMSMQIETGGTIAVIAYSQIPMSIIVQSFILGDMPNLLEGGGIALILVSGIWAVVAESNERHLPQTVISETENGYKLLPMNNLSDSEERGAM